MPFYIAAGFVAAAVIVGGLLAVLLAFSGLLIAVGRLVPDFHTPLFHELPASKRARLRGGAGGRRAKR